jgi:hypothetical protein
MMKFGFFTDRGLDTQNLDKHPWNKVKTNSQGYRCPEWEPMPEGKKNVVVLGCSHTFGQGLEDDQHWVHFLSQHNSDRLRYWNLGVPGASGEALVRRLWGTQKLIDPKIIIVCWPPITRREWYDKEITPVHGASVKLHIQNKRTDLSNHLHNVFWIEKYAEVNQAKTFYCHSMEQIKHPDLDRLNILDTYTLANCWPYWDKFEQRTQYKEPSLASDGEHYGVEHHKRFAQLFLDYFGQKLK